MGIGGLKLKVCGMRDAHNVASVAALCPEYIGFIFVPESPRFAGQAVTREIVRSLPSGVKSIGVFRNEKIDAVVSLAKALGLAGVQLHGMESRKYIGELREKLPDAIILRAVGMGSTSDLESLLELDGMPDLFVLDQGGGGSGVPFDWRILAGYRAATPFLLAGGVGMENIGAAMQLAQAIPKCVGFDINSKVEVEPGLKDIGKVRDVKQRMAQ